MPRRDPTKRTAIQKPPDRENRGSSKKGWEDASVLDEMTQSCPMKKKELFYKPKVNSTRRIWRQKD